MFQLTQASFDFALRVTNTLAIIGFVVFAVVYIADKICNRKK